MTILKLCLGAVVVFSPSAAMGQTAQPNSMVLAQMQDRCMTTYAVRMSKTAASDEVIYSAAIEGCKELEEKLFATLREERPEAEATQIINMLEEQSQPNFQALLTRIRSDRLQRSGQ